MIEDRYVVVAANSGQFGSGDLDFGGLATRAFRVFSNRHVAESHSSRRIGGRCLNLREVGLEEFRRMLGCARERGYARVNLDGHEIGLDAFAKLVEHEQRE